MNGAVSWHTVLVAATAATVAFSSVARADAAPTAPVAEGRVSTPAAAPPTRLLKAQGLREKYNADAKTCMYFTLHSTWDVHHSKVWAEQIDQLVDQLADGHDMEEIIAAVEDAATAMWKSLDGIHLGGNCNN